MQQLNRNLPVAGVKHDFPKKVLIFGENAFACLAFDELIKKGLFCGSVTVAGRETEIFKKQQGLFTIIERDVESGKKTEIIKIITCVSDYINPYNDFDCFIKRAQNPVLRFVVAGTEDAEKTATLLYERFTFFKGEMDKGLVFLACEPIENNGAKLKILVQQYADKWGLSDEFTRWTNNACFFANTLTDRITVSNLNYDEVKKFEKKLGYRDELLTICEPFYFWAIELPAVLRAELPLDRSGLNVVFNEDITPHRLRKTRLLDGALTALAPAALLHGYKTMNDAMSNPGFKKYIEKTLFKEIIPTLDINRNVLDGFTKTIIERLCNPLVKQELLLITENQVSNFKTRVLPTILEYHKRFKQLPPMLMFSFAVLVAFYKNGGRFPLADDERSIAFLRDNRLDTIFKNISGAWGTDLTEILEKTQFKTIVEEYFNIIKKHGVKPLIERLAGE
ncbi:MAG: hypothetical protein FWE74_08155 [Oscillospiraceae bacterium]|nr:hypothetical protein [Oscillospiraceae bacterium]